jgi:hypothetical protein
VTAKVHVDPSAGGKLVIVNLQKTPKDKKATLLIHGKTDMVMKQVKSLDWSHSTLLTI